MDKFNKALIAKIISLIPEQVVPGTVKSVDKNKLTISVNVTGEDIELFDVRLSPAGSAASSIVMIPAINSVVLVGIIKNNPSANYLVHAQTVDEIILRGGSEGGLIKINELRDQMKKDTDILEALLDVIKGSVITEPGNGSPSALQASLKAKIGSKKPGDYSKIENERITHG